MGLPQEDYSRVLMTYHINGGASSAELWHDAPWLDFNMAQTWDKYQNIYPALLRDFERQPVKPCGLGEGAYEDGPQYPTKPIDALVIRRQACWSWFAGSYHTYGNGNVWHFDTVKPELTQTWKVALRSPGAGQPPQFNPRYLDFARHYGFKIRACGVKKAHEKGRFENAVGYVKQNLLRGMELPPWAALNPAARHWLEIIAKARRQQLLHRFLNHLTELRLSFILENHEALAQQGAREQ